MNGVISNGLLPVMRSCAGMLNSVNCTWQLAHHASTWPFLALASLLSVFSARLPDASRSPVRKCTTLQQCDGPAHHPVGDAERVHHVEGEQRDVRRLEHVAAGVEDEIRLLGRFRVAEPPARLGALAEPLQHLAGELHAREHVDVLAELAEIHHALAPARRRLVAPARHRDPRHRQKEARIDALVARLDAFAAEHAGVRPPARRLRTFAGAQDVEYARDHVARLGGDAARIGHRTGFDALAAARAGRGHLGDAVVEGVLVGHAHGRRCYQQAKSRATRCGNG